MTHSLRFGPDEGRTHKQELSRRKIDQTTHAGGAASQGEIVHPAVAARRSIQDDRHAEQNFPGFGVEHRPLRSLVDDHHAHPGESVAASHREDHQRTFIVIVGRDVVVQPDAPPHPRWLDSRVPESWSPARCGARHGHGS